MAHRSESHAGDAQVFAQGGGVFHVKFIKGDDAVDRLPAREVTDSIDHGPRGEIFGHVEKVVHGFAGPIASAQFLDGEKQNAAAFIFAGAEEFLTLFIGGDAEDG
jgi:hypothetical protein